MKYLLEMSSMAGENRKFARFSEIHEGRKLDLRKRRLPALTLTLAFALKLTFTLCLNRVHSRVRKRRKKTKNEKENYSVQPSRYGRSRSAFAAALVVRKFSGSHSKASPERYATMPRRTVSVRRPP